MKLEELYEKKVICKVCNEEFVTSKVRISKLRLVKKDSDFLAHYEGENPVKYGVFVCPHCGYAAMESKFNNISFRGKETILKEIASRWNKREFSGKRSNEEAIEAYKLALYCGELLNYKKLDMANICLRIGWLYRIVGSQEEKKFLNLALGLYKEAYLNESLNGSSMDEITLGYLIGELSRRLDNKEEALKWFNTVLSNPKTKNNAALEGMVREQWMNIREG